MEIFNKFKKRKALTFAPTSFAQYKAYCQLIAQIAAGESITAAQMAYPYLADAMQPSEVEALPLAVIQDAAKLVEHYAKTHTHREYTAMPKKVGGLRAPQTDTEFSEQVSALAFAQMEKALREHEHKPMLELAGELVAIWYTYQLNPNAAIAEYRNIVGLMPASEVAPLGFFLSRRCRAMLRKSPTY